MARNGYTVRVTVEDFTNPTDNDVCSTVTYETWALDCFHAMHVLLQYVIEDYGNCADCWFFIHVMAKDTEDGVVYNRMFGAINGTRGK